MWVFDAPTGTWQSPRWTDWLQRRAAELAKAAYRYDPTLSTPRSAGGLASASLMREYGRGLPSDIPKGNETQYLEPLAISLAGVLPMVSVWSTLPHLRRAAGRTVVWYGCGIGIVTPETLAELNAIPNSIPIYRRRWWHGLWR